MSNYPPGVTGSEYAIAGADYEQEVDEPCPKCGGELVEQGYHGQRWVMCYSCEYSTDLEPLEPDWDTIAAQRREEP